MEKLVKKKEFMIGNDAHDDIEVYGPGGREHLGTMDPTDGSMIKDPVSGRSCKK